MKQIVILGDTFNKVSDTSSEFRFNLIKDTVIQDVTGKTVSVTIANASGYLFDITPKNNGTEVKLDFSDDKLKELTPDTYKLEINVTNTDGNVEIYPSNGAVEFLVTRNLKSHTGTLVPQITFDTVLADVKKAVDEKVADYVKTIAKGDKGDTGPQGPAGKDAPSNDAQLVHNTGNETINGDKTFTGTIYANNRIQGSLATRIANFTDLATVASDMYSYQGIWWFGSGTLLNSPVSSYVLVEVFHGSIKTNGYIRVTAAISGDSYYANVNGGLSTWNKYAQDVTVVHNTGNETVAGNKTLTGLTTILVGNYGFRVTSSGFEKTTDGGKTWVKTTL